MTVTRHDRRDAGATTVELLVLTPVAIAMLCLVVGLGRLADARGQLTGASRDAARAASLTSTPASARDAARAAAAADLTGAGIACRGLAVTVDTTRFVAGGRVTTRVACTVDLSAVALSGLPGHASLAASATVPLDSYAGTGP